ncbi:hypothetical protein TNCV_719781 [Trichonephila clavipes]|nr:hypothetical protein TNCV_719781 [Trichonephila clavipes]
MSSLSGPLRALPGPWTTAPSTQWINQHCVCTVLWYDQQTHALYVFENGTMIGQRYIDEVSLPHVLLYCCAIDENGFFSETQSAFLIGLESAEGYPLAVNGFPQNGKFPKNIPNHDVFMGTLPSSRRGKRVTLFGGLCTVTMVSLWSWSWLALNSHLDAPLKTHCKESLPAPGNRSNERRYKEKDLARTEEKKVGTGEERE